MFKGNSSSLNLDYLRMTKETLRPFMNLKGKSFRVKKMNMKQ